MRKALVVLACVLSNAMPAYVQPRAADPVDALVRRLERVLSDGDKAAFPALFDPSVSEDTITQHESDLFFRGAVRNGPVRTKPRPARRRPRRRRFQAGRRDVHGDARARADRHRGPRHPPPAWRGCGLVANLLDRLRVGDQWPIQAPTQHHDPAGCPQSGAPLRGRDRRHAGGRALSRRVRRWCDRDGADRARRAALLTRVGDRTWAAAPLCWHRIPDRALRDGVRPHQPERLRRTGRHGGAVGQHVGCPHGAPGAGRVQPAGHQVLRRRRRRHESRFVASAAGRR